jgi:hypothetical protein
VRVIVLASPDVSGTRQSHCVPAEIAGPVPSVNEESCPSQ